jgi:hypothetical protein
MAMGLVRAPTVSQIPVSLQGCWPQTRCILARARLSEPDPCVSCLRQDSRRAPPAASRQAVQPVCIAGETMRICCHHPNRHSADASRSTNPRRLVESFAMKRPRRTEAKWLSRQALFVTPALTPNAMYSSGRIRTPMD